VTTQLARRLGTGDAVVIGLGSMLGAGVFVAIAPAARAAGAGLLIGLAIAAVVAYCNADSSARLAALYPESGGTYIYGRERLGSFWGYLAGWAFVVGKLASCAAIAATFAAYAAPGQRRLVAVAAVLVVTALNVAGVKKSTAATRVIVALVMLVLGVVVVACLGGGSASTHHLEPFPGGGAHGILQAAALIFFAFAGYARIATLGEEVRDPAQTIPRAIPIALATTLAIYAIVFVAALAAVGSRGLASSTFPLRTAVEAGSLHSLAPVVRVGAALAAFGSLLALVLGISRTVLAMARDGHLPTALSAVHNQLPRRAELAVGLVVAVLAATLDLRNAVGFSSFGVLLYYAIANASAWTLWSRRIVPALGFAGCMVLAANLPLVDVLSGTGVVLVGCIGYAATRTRNRRRPGVESGASSSTQG